jgi:hypothetical protein
MNATATEILADTRTDTRTEAPAPERRCPRRACRARRAFYSVAYPVVSAAAAVAALLLCQAPPDTLAQDAAITPHAMRAPELPVG